jgi:CRP/FNR family transcriptional regulator
MREDANDGSTDQLAGAAGLLEDLARDGLTSGFLFAMPPAAAERLLAEGIRINVPAGSVVYRDEESPRLLVVVSGLLRIFVSSPDGRQVTVRYARSGDVAGLALVVGGPAPMSIQAMTPTLLMALRTATLRDLLRVDPGVARACAEELGRQVHQLLLDVAEQAFLTVRQRLARQLLLLASPGAGRHLVVTASQQELADAIGSVREVVTRTLHDLREERLVRASGAGILLVDPLRLSEEAGVHAAARGPSPSAR